MPLAPFFMGGGGKKSLHSLCLTLTLVLSHFLSFFLFFLYLPSNRHKSVQTEYKCWLVIRVFINSGSIMKTRLPFSWKQTTHKCVHIWCFLLLCHNLDHRTLKYKLDLDILDNDNDDINNNVVFNFLNFVLNPMFLCYLGYKKWELQLAWGLVWTFVSHISASVVPLWMPGAYTVLYAKQLQADKPGTMPSMTW